MPTKKAGIVLLDHLGFESLPKLGLPSRRPRTSDATWRGRAAHGVITKTYSVTHLNVNEASRRYSPAQVIALEYETVSGVPSDISAAVKVTMGDLFD